jgi:hypothetical protein
MAVKPDIVDFRYDAIKSDKYNYLQGTVQIERCQTPEVHISQH